MSQATVIVLSDSTGQTAEKVARAALRQFHPTKVDVKVIPYVTTISQVEAIIHEAKTLRAAIVYSMVKDDIRDALKRRAAKNKLVCIDVLSPTVHAFEQWLGQTANHETGLVYQLDDDYFRRISAMEFMVQYDDLKDPRGLLLADVVLIGVSRTSKTPLSMYLAYSRKYNVVNVPLVPEVPVPPQLFQIPKQKVFGLLIRPEQLFEIRKERLVQLGLDESAIYADQRRIEAELKYAMDIMAKVGCVIIDVTNKALEETANMITDHLHSWN